MRLAGSFTTPPRTASSPLRTSLLTSAAVVDPLPPQGAAPSGVSQVDPVEPAEVAVDSRPARGAEPERAKPERSEPGGAESGGAETGGAEPGGARSGGTEPGVAESGGAAPGVAESGGAEPGGVAVDCEAPGGPPSSQQLREWYLRYCSLRRGASRARGATGVGTRVSPPRREPPSSPQLREWYARHISLRSGAAGAGVPGVDAAAGAADPGAGGAAAAGGATGGAARTEDPGVGAAAGAADPGTGGAAAAAAGVEDPEGGASAGTEDPAAGVSAGSGVAARPRPYFVPLLQQVLGQRPPPCPPLALECPPSVQSQPQLPPASPLPEPAPYTGPTGGLAERREPASRPVSPASRRASPVCAATTGSRTPFALLVLLSHSLLATVVTDPSFESAAASALVTELVDFAAACPLDYAASLVAESESVCPPSVGGECALGTDVLEDRQEEFGCLAAALPHLVSMLVAPEGDPDAPDIPTPRSYAEAMAGPYSSQWQSAMDTEMASWKSTGTYVDEVPPPGANIVSGMWIFRVKRPPGSPPVFKARYVHEASGSLHEEIWLRHPPGFTGSFPLGTQWSLRRPVYGLRQAPREWHDTLRTTLAALGFAPSTADPSLFLRTDTSLPPFYILVYVDDLVFATSDTAGLAHVKSEHAEETHVHRPGTSGMGLVLGGRDRPVLTGHSDASWADDLATQRSSQGYTFSLGSGSVSWRSTRSSSVLSSSCEAEIYATAMAAQELRWLTYLLTDLGEQPRSPPLLYVDNKATIALCQEHRLEHRTKHIALRYFLARELQQRSQLLLRYVATEANTADVFTKALPPVYHQRFCTLLGLVPTVPHLLTS
ncbi:unnamed protein product [Closterium sp. NIES-64]|nr:unnamed protein product [Closterium sp. NIES-64]